MAKMLTVYTLYTDEVTMKTIISRLVEHSRPFHSTGEFLYSNFSWDHFLKTYCSDIKAPITQDIETWPAESLNFESYDNDERVHIYENGELSCVIRTNPGYFTKVSNVLSKLCRFAATHGYNVQFSTF